eukprot:g20001.t1
MRTEDSSAPRSEFRGGVTITPGREPGSRTGASAEQGAPPGGELGDAQLPGRSLSQEAAHTHTTPAKLASATPARNLQNEKGTSLAEARATNTTTSKGTGVVPGSKVGFGFNSKGQHAFTPGSLGLTSSSKRESTSKDGRVVRSALVSEDEVLEEELDGDSADPAEKQLPKEEAWQSSYSNYGAVAPPQPKSETTSKATNAGGVGGPQAGPGGGGAPSSAAVSKSAATVVGRGGEVGNVINDMLKNEWTNTTPWRTSLGISKAAAEQSEGPPGAMASFSTRKEEHGTPTEEHNHKSTLWIFGIDTL